jgi:hypothetical protein
VKKAHDYTSEQHWDIWEPILLRPLLCLKFLE